MVRVMNGRASQRKGSDFERALAAYFNTSVFAGQDRVSRAPLSGGGFTSLNSGGSDLLGLPNLFVEAKRTERLNIREALLQAEGNRYRRNALDDLPIVITRRNQEPLARSIVALRLEDFLTLYTAYLDQRGLR